jgi:hypothetical protein
MVSATPMVIKGNVIAPPQLAFDPTVGVGCLIFLCHKVVSLNTYALDCRLKTHSMGSGILCEKNSSRP